MTADERFPVDVARVLLDAGWFPGREISDRIAAWTAANSDKLPGGQLADAPRAFLNEFGGLILPQYGPLQNIGGGFTSALHPMTDSVFLGGVATLDEEYGLTAFPVGYNADGAELDMDAAGRMFFVHWADEFYVGENPDQSSINLIRGIEWAKVYQVQL